MNACNNNSEDRHILCMNIHNVLPVHAVYCTEIDICK